MFTCYISHLSCFTEKVDQPVSVQWVCIGYVSVNRLVVSTVGAICTSKPRHVTTCRGVVGLTNDVYTCPVLYQNFEFYIFIPRHSSFYTSDTSGLGLPSLNNSLVKWTGSLHPPTGDGLALASAKRLMAYPWHALSACSGAGTDDHDLDMLGAESLSLFKSCEDEVRSTASRASSVSSRLPRCAVVNFQRDGDCVSMRPRATTDTGKLVCGHLSTPWARRIILND